MQLQGSGMSAGQVHVCKLSTWYMEMLKVGEHIYELINAEQTGCILRKCVSNAEQKRYFL